MLDANGMVTNTPDTYPQYDPVGPFFDGELTEPCQSGGNDEAAACGNFAVNTVQPAAAPPQRGRSPDPADRRHGVPEHR